MANLEWRIDSGPDSRFEIRSSRFAVTSVWLFVRKRHYARTVMVVEQTEIGARWLVPEALVGNGQD